MQPFFIPESLEQREARLTCAAEWARLRAESDRPPRPARLRVAVGRALVAAGSRLVPDPSDRPPARSPEGAA